MKYKDDMSCAPPGFSFLQDKQKTGQKISRYTVPSTIFDPLHSGGHKEMSSISWLTNSALLFEPKCGGRGGSGVSGSANESTAVHIGARINFKDLTPY
jgi:hypothetical protein